jgi:hypothetical protein
MNVVGGVSGFRASQLCLVLGVLQIDCILFGRALPACSPRFSANATLFLASKRFFKVIPCFWVGFMVVKIIAF